LLSTKLRSGLQNNFLGLNLLALLFQNGFELPLYLNIKLTIDHLVLLLLRQLLLPASYLLLMLHLRNLLTNSLSVFLFFHQAVEQGLHLVVTHDLLLLRHNAAETGTASPLCVFLIDQIDVRVVALALLKVSCDVSDLGSQGLFIQHSSRLEGLLLLLPDELIELVFLLVRWPPDMRSAHPSIPGLHLLLLFLLDLLPESVLVLDSSSEENRFFLFFWVEVGPLGVLLVLFLLDGRGFPTDPTARKLVKLTPSHQGLGSAERLLDLAIVRGLPLDVLCTCTSVHVDCIDWWEGCLTEVLKNVQVISLKEPSIDLSHRPETGQ
jgi:hypothetical protein